MNLRRCGFRHPSCRVRSLPIYASAGPWFETLGGRGGPSGPSAPSRHLAISPSRLLAARAAGGASRFARRRADAPLRRHALRPSVATAAVLLAMPGVERQPAAGGSSPPAAVLRLAQPQRVLRPEGWAAHAGWELQLGGVCARRRQWAERGRARRAFKCAR